MANKKRVNKRSKKDFKQMKSKEGQPAKPVFDSKVKGCHGDDTYISKSNDINWYTRFPQLVIAQSSIIFNKRYGSMYGDETNNNSSAPSAVAACQSAIPGVIRCDFRPTIKAKGTLADAINIFSKNLFTFVRHANSGHVNYESSDLVQYILTVVVLYANIEQLKRALRCSLTYSPENVYWYRVVLGAMGYSTSDVDAIYDNYAEYVGKLNVLIAQLSSFRLPQDINIMKRFNFLCASVFKDDDLHKSTYYVCNLTGYYHYDWPNSKLIWTPFGFNTSFTQRIAALRAEVQNLLSIEDVGIMMGDILKAFGENTCFAPSLANLDEAQDAQYNEEMIWQFRNAVCPDCYDSHPVIEQVSGNSQILVEKYIDINSNLYPTGYEGANPGEIASPLKGAVEDALNTGNTLDDSTTYRPMVSIDKDQPTSEDVIYGTRFSTTVEVSDSQLSGSNDYILTRRDCGTEIISNMYLYNYESTTDSGTGNVVARPFSTLTWANDIADLSIKSTTLGLLEGITGAPYCRLRSSDSGSSQAMIRFGLHGLNNLVVDSDWLNNLNDGVTLSEFDVPMLRTLETK